MIAGSNTEEKIKAFRKWHKTFFQKKEEERHSDINTEIMPLGFDLTPIQAQTRTSLQPARVPGGVVGVLVGRRAALQAGRAMGGHARKEAALHPTQQHLGWHFRRQKTGLRQNREQPPTEKPHDRTSVRKC